MHVCQLQLQYVPRIQDGSSSTLGWETGSPRFNREFWPQTAEEFVKMRCRSEMDSFLSVSLLLDLGTLTSSYLDHWTQFMRKMSPFLEVNCILSRPQKRPRSIVSGIGLRGKPLLLALTRGRSKSKHHRPRFYTTIPRTCLFLRIFLLEYGHVKGTFHSLILLYRCLRVI